MTCAHCEELEEKIRQLEKRIYGREWESPTELRLTLLEESIVATLLHSGRVCSPDFLIDATRGRRGTHASHPQSNLIDSKICHIRAKFKPFGLGIETIWGRGYRLKPESRDRLLNWQNQEAA